MFFSFLPLRPEGASPPRPPWTSLALGALTLLCFAGTWVVPQTRRAESAQAFDEAARYWAMHPYLRPPAGLTERLGVKQSGAAFRDLHAPDAETTAAEQAELDARGTRFQEMDAGGILQRLAFVPARGLAQIGLVTHVFLAAGWMALAGTLVFLLFLGPLFENTWGRPIFLGLYVLGGASSAAVQYALNPASTLPVIGAWGAVAACVGAFTLRFGLTRVQIAYVYGFFRSVRRDAFLLPAWLGILLWASVELSLPRDGGATDVARLAHLATFGLGFVVAAAVRLSRMEERWLQPEIDQALLWEQHPGVERGRAALGRGDLVEAREAFAQAFAADARNVDAEVGLIQVDLKAGELRGIERLEGVLTRCLGEADVARVQDVIRQLGDSVDPDRLRPLIALRTAAALEEGPTPLESEAERFYAAVGTRSGPIAARALLRATELRLASNRDPAAAAAYLRGLNQLSGVPDEYAGRIERAHVLLEEKRGGPTLAAAPVPRRIPSLLEFPALPEPPPGEPKIVRGKLLEVSGDMLRVESESGRQHQILLSNVLAVGVGMTPAPTPDAPRRNVVVTDLVVTWGDRSHGPGVLRLESTGLRLPTLYPGVPPSQAYRRFLEHILERSGANTLGATQEALNGAVPRFASESELTAALYHPGQMPAAPYPTHRAS